MLKELTLEKFVHEVASSSPAPGGGSVAALSGSLAAGLLSMYCNLSRNREKLGDAVDVIEEVGREARLLMNNMAEAIDEDTAAFNRVMDAYRLPKESDREKNERGKAIREAAAYAAEVPLKTARDSLRLLSLVGKVAGKGNRSAVTDLGVANMQALSALTGACYNVKINLAMLSDRQAVDVYKRDVKELLQQGRSRFEKNRAMIEKDIR